MKVIKAFPPNYSEIRAAFPFVRGRSVIFAYGDRIYYPSGGKLSPALMEHEGVHGRRQAGDPAAWWRRYISDTAFRLDEEVVAHKAEYASLARSGGSQKDLDYVVNRLCSPLYGAGITKERATALMGI